MKGVETLEFLNIWIFECFTAKKLFFETDYFYKLLNIANYIYRSQKGVETADILYFLNIFLFFYYKFNGI